MLQLTHQAQADERGNRLAHTRVDRFGVPFGRALRCHPAVLAAAYGIVAQSSI